MNTQNNAAQTRYLKEVALNLRREGFKVGCLEAQHLLVSWNGSNLCRISSKGSILYRQETVDTLDVQKALNEVVRIVTLTREYMRMLEYAPPLKAQGLTGDYRILADFNTSVLAAHPTEQGVQFVVWDWDFDRKGVHLGGYYQEDYETAKQDFATRSGLIRGDAIFSLDQFIAMYRALAFVREQDETLTFGRDQELQEIMEQISRLCPEVIAQVQETTLEQTME